MSNVNRNPAGALELLNLNLQGEFPRALGKEISPTLEMSDTYLAGIGFSSARAVDATSITPGDFFGITIPAFELWAVRGVSLSAINNDVASVNGSVHVVAQLPTSSEMVMAQGAIQVIAAGNQLRVGAVFERPIILPAGTGILAVYSVITGAAVVNGFGSVLDVVYYKLTLS